MKILDLEIDNLSQKEILDKINVLLSESGFHQIATINPEFVLEAQNNLNFQKIVNACDLKIADGIGILLGGFLQGKLIKHRFAGADLIFKILEKAQEKKLDVFLVCRKDGLSLWKETRDAILKIYPSLNILGDDIEAGNNKYKIGIKNEVVLFCNFGTPEQEIFINSQKCATIRLAMGVGGSFDFITGKITRAPYFLRFLGLEWFWRLIQPQEWKFKKQRIKRICKSLIIFPIKIILDKL